MKKINYKTRHNNLLKKAEALNGKGYDLPFLAIQSAEENASTCFSFDSPDWYQLAYGSIQDTSWYVENADCRKWFKSNGYEA